MAITSWVLQKLLTEKMQNEFSIVSFPPLQDICINVSKILKLQLNVIELAQNLKKENYPQIFHTFRKIIFIHTCRPDHLHEDFLNGLFFFEALRSSSGIKAYSIYTYLPYLRSYQHDNENCLPLRLLKKASKDVDLEQIHVLDPHARDEEFIQPISPIKLLSDFSEEYLFIAPDKGSYNRNLKSFKNLIQLEKQRSGEDVVISYPHPNDLKGKKFLIIDDMIDTGKTLFAAKDYLISCGAEDVKTFATHTLGQSNADFTTNSFGQATSNNVFDISNLLAAYINNIIFP